MNSRARGLEAGEQPSMTRSTMCQYRVLLIYCTVTSYIFDSSATLKLSHRAQHNGHRGNGKGRVQESFDQMQAEPPEWADLDISPLEVRGPEGFGKSYDTDITDLDDLLVSGEDKF